MAGPAEQPLQQLIIGGRRLPNGLLPCFGCGFDLRGSAPAGRCPECGQTYRREALYRDVAMQKLKHIFDDVNFVFAAAMGIGHLSLCLIIAQLLSGRDFTSSLALFVIPGILVLGFSYLLVVALYVGCWVRLANQLVWRETICWGQVCGVGLARALCRAGISLAAPPIIVACLML